MMSAIGQGPRDPVRALQDYWESLAGGAAPERHLLNPAAIVPLLPSLLLAEFEHDPFRVHYRLTGTLVDHWNTFNITGRYLDELVDEGGNGAVAILMVAYRRCYEGAIAVTGEYDWPNHQGSTLTVRFGLFPLRLDGVVRQCIAVEDYSAVPHRYGWSKT